MISRRGKRRNENSFLLFVCLMENLSNRTDIFYKKLRKKKKNEQTNKERQKKWTRESTVNE